MTERGSSPWARGTQWRETTNSGITRFIPVGTGNTTSKPDPADNSTVHPRGHGEHRCLDHASSISCGSSPWARGTLKKSFVLLLVARFIPVGTGNT